MLNSKRLRVGIIGVGSVGRLHLQALKELDVDVVCASNIRRNPSIYEPELDGLREHKSAENLIKDPVVDVVVICSESASHASHALLAIRSGKHVVIEKPIAVDPVAAALIEKEAAASKNLVTVISQRRFEAQHQYLMKLISDGILGQAILIEGFTHWHRDESYYAGSLWRREMSHGGGSLMNQGIHVLDLMLWLFGPVAEIRGDFATLRHDMNAEDTSVATLRFKSGALGVHVTSTAIPNPTPARLDIFMSRGSISLENNEISHWDVPGLDRPPVSIVPGGSSDPAAIGALGHKAQWRDIIAAIQEERQPLVTCASAFETARVCAAIYEAGATGRTIRLDENESLNSWLNRQY